MPDSPPADSGPRILFFSRGRGSGHAIPDLEIARRLKRLRPDAQVAFVSYGTGARTIAAHKAPLVDLQLPESGDFAEMILRAGKTIAKLDPYLVVSHEETAVLGPAKIFDKATAYLTDFFADPMSVGMHQLVHADQVLFLGGEGLFEEPPTVSGRVEYVGRVLREFQCGPADRARARFELGLAEDDTVISVLPGSWTEEMAPIFDLLLPAFDKANLQSKRLIWLAGVDQETIAARVTDRTDVTVLDRDWQIDRLFVASDLAITKANRMTVLELDALGIPSIALSSGRNPIDDRIVASLPTVAFLPSSETDPAQLATLLEARSKLTVAPAPESQREGARKAAEALSRLLPPRI